MEDRFVKNAVVKWINMVKKSVFDQKISGQKSKSSIISIGSFGMAKARPM